MTSDERSDGRKSPAGRSFSQQTAFVLQFSAESDPEHGLVEGRVEHLASGDKAAFGSLEDLWGFVRSVLARSSAGAAPADRDES